MYRVTLVDDEPWSATSLQKAMPWEEFGFEVTAIETDSVVALEHIKDSPPDVVFTDIRMPELSGIDLLRKTREARRELVFVIVSGYDDFKYAQEAIRLGAADYVLKPVDSGEGRKLLERLRARLDAGRHSDDKGAYARLLGAPEEAASYIAQRGVGPTEGRWRAVAFASPSEPIPDSLFPRLAALPESLLLRPEPSWAVLLACGRDREELDREVVPDAFRLAGVHVGLSGEGRGRDIPRLLAQADLASREYFFGRPPREVAFSSTPSPALEKLLMSIGSALSCYNYLRAALSVERLSGLARSEGLGLFHIEAFWNRTCALMEEWKIGGAVEVATRHMGGADIVRNFGSLESFCAYVIKLIGRGVTAPQLKNVDSGRVNPRFLDLLDYVNENYAKKLSLSEVASRFDLNKNYCCELFARHTELTFTDYVTELRMKKAWELLKAGEHEPAEIAEMVGYSDYYYFSRVFKRHFQVAPTGARARIPRE